MARLLVLKAGSATSNSVIRSLRGDPSLFIVGCHDDLFVLRKSTANSNYVVPPDDDAASLEALRRIVELERIDLIVPTRDADVLKIVTTDAGLSGRTFLPSKEVVKLCQDKYALTKLFRDRGIPAPLTYLVNTLDEIEDICRRLQPYEQLWCRIRTGFNSRGAIPVKKPEQARSWIEYWEQMHGVVSGSFTISEYLPGRDFCVQCLYQNGSLVLMKMAERLSYFNNGSPSGVSSMATLAKTAFEPRVAEVCAKAIQTLDDNVSGVLFLDIKERADGTPCITEINAGRFAMMTNLHDLTGKHNMAVAYARLGLGEAVDIHDPFDFAEDFYLVRSIDTVPVVMRGSETSTQIKDARAL